MCVGLSDDRQDSLIRNKKIPLQEFARMCRKLIATVDNWLAADSFPVQRHLSPSFVKSASWYGRPFNKKAKSGRLGGMICFVGLSRSAAVAVPDDSSASTALTLRDAGYRIMACPDGRSSPQLLAGTTHHANCEWLQTVFVKFLPASSGELELNCPVGLNGTFWESHNQGKRAGGQASQCAAPTTR